MPDKPGLALLTRLVILKTSLECRRGHVSLAYTGEPIPAALVQQLIDLDCLCMLSPREYVLTDKGRQVGSRLDSRRLVSSTWGKMSRQGKKSHYFHEYRILDSYTEYQAPCGAAALAVYPLGPDDDPGLVCRACLNAGAAAYSP